MVSDRWLLHGFLSDRKLAMNAKGVRLGVMARCRASDVAIFPYNVYTLPTAAALDSRTPSMLPGPRKGRTH